MQAALTQAAGLTTAMAITSAELRDKLWAVLEPRLFVTREQFDTNLKGWELEPVVIGGDLAFIVISKGPEFHYHSLGTGHGIPLQFARELTNRLIARHGYAETSTPKDDVRQQRFNRRFGFVAVGDDGFDIRFRIERVNHA
jgi:hypothetical protein